VKKALLAFRDRSSHTATSQPFYTSTSPSFPVLKVKSISVSEIPNRVATMKFSKK
jgi:hypothetical protein